MHNPTNSVPTLEDQIATAVAMVVEAYIAARESEGLDIIQVERNTHRFLKGELCYVADDLVTHRRFIVAVDHQGGPHHPFQSARPGDTVSWLMPDKPHAVVGPYLFLGKFVTDARFECRDRLEVVLLVRDSLKDVQA